jgi:hypothetical protein
MVARVNCWPTGTPAQDPQRGLRYADDGGNRRGAAGAAGHSGHAGGEGDRRAFLSVFTLDQGAPECPAACATPCSARWNCARWRWHSVLIGVLAGTWLAEYGEGKRLADVVRF